MYLRNSHILNELKTKHSRPTYLPPQLSPHVHKSRLQRAHSSILIHTQECPSSITSQTTSPHPPSLPGPQKLKYLSKAYMTEAKEPNHSFHSPTPQHIFYSLDHHSNPGKGTANPISADLHIEAPLNKIEYWHCDLRTCEALVVVLNCPLIERTYPRGKRSTRTSVSMPNEPAS